MWHLSCFPIYESKFMKRGKIKMKTLSSIYRMEPNTMAKAVFSLTLILSGLILAGPAIADTYSFGDNSNTWPGYQATNDTYGPDNQRG